MPHTAGARATQKLRTRQSLLEAALRLMELRSLSGLSLREVAREAGIVPAGFYRHFPDMERLGVALVEQCLGSLRGAIRGVRVGRSDSEEIIRRSVELLVEAVHADRERFRFIARERFGGVTAVREAIRRELDLFGAELARDLLAGDIGTVSDLARWKPEDLRMMTSLIVNHMVLTAAAILDASPEDPDAESDIIETACRQLRLIAIGGQHWLDPDPPPAGGTAPVHRQPGRPAATPAP